MELTSTLKSETEKTEETLCSEAIGSVAICGACPLLRMLGDCPKTISQNTQDTEPLIIVDEFIKEQSEIMAQNRPSYLDSLEKFDNDTEQNINKSLYLNEYLAEDNSSNLAEIETQLPEPETIQKRQNKLSSSARQVRTEIDTLERKIKKVSYLEMLFDDSIKVVVAKNLSPSQDKSRKSQIKKQTTKALTSENKSSIKSKEEQKVKYTSTRIDNTNNIKSRSNNPIKEMAESTSIKYKITINEPGRPAEPKPEPEPEPNIEAKTKVPKSIFLPKHPTLLNEHMEHRTIKNVQKIKNSSKHDGVLKVTHKANIPSVTKKTSTPTSPIIKSQTNIKTDLNVILNNSNETKNEIYTTNINYPVQEETPDITPIKEVLVTEGRHPSAKDPKEEVDDIDQDSKPVLTPESQQELELEPELELDLAPRAKPDLQSKINKNKVTSRNKIKDLKVKDRQNETRIITRTYGYVLSKKININKILAEIALRTTLI